MNYHEAQARLGKQSSRKLENNTYLERRDEETIAVRLHKTDILTFKSDGSCRYDSGGWKTMTTRDRMNKYGPARVYQDRGAWEIGREGYSLVLPYADGATVHTDGSITGFGTDDERELRRKVLRYSQRFIANLEAGNVPEPSGGDCWFCSMRTVGEGKPLGEVNQDRNHILEHIEERYYVPSLLWRAVEVNGPQAAQWYVGSFWQSGIEENTKRYYRGFKIYAQRSLRKYLYRQLGLVA